MVPVDGLTRGVGVDLAAGRQHLQGAHHHRVGVDVEEPAGPGPGVGEAEAVRTQGRELVGHVLADLIGHVGGEVRGGHDRAGGAFQLAGHERHPLLLLRVQHRLLLGLAGVPAQLVPGGHGPHVSGDLPVLGQDPLRLQGPRHRHAGGEQLGPRPVDLGGLEQVDALEDPLHVHVLRLGRLHDRLVVHREVVHDVVVFVALAVHVLQAALDDVGDLVAVGGVVVAHRRVGRGQDRGVPVHVLQALAGQGRAPGRRADDEPAGELVRGGPEAVAGALEAEHRVEDVHRDHRDAVGGVGGADGGERRGGPGLVDAHVQQLTVRGLLVGQHQLAIHGQVVLAVGVVDLLRGEEGVHAEGAGLIRDDRDDPLAELLVPHQVLEQAHEGHGGGRHLLARALLGPGVGLLRGQGDGPLVSVPDRDEPAELPAPFQHVLDLRGVRTRVVVRGAVEVLLQLLVGDGDAQAIPEDLEVLQGQLLHLVGRVAALEVGAQPVALDALGQDDGGPALGLQGLLVGRIDLAVVVGAALEGPDLVVGHVRDHLLGLGGAPEEVLADEAAVLRLVGLVVPVQRLVHDLHELAVLVLLQQRVPLAAPDDLDDVPAGAAEERLQLLDDLAVAAHRPVQALEVAVDDEGEVVQLVVGRQLQGAARLGLVHFAVAEEGPDVLLGGVLDPAVVQVLVELRLVDRVERAQTHGHGGELPEVLLAPGVRVGGHLVAGLGLLLPEGVQVLLGQSALEVGAGVVAGGGVALEVDLVPAAGVVLAAEEVVQAHLVEGCHAGVAGDVTAHPDLGALGAVDHDGGVPAQQRAVPALDLLIARELRLLVHGDGVDVVGGGHGGDLNGLGPGPLQQAADDELGPLGALGLDELVEGLHPLGCLLVVLVGHAGGELAEDVVVRR
ncbi:Uncharacterised protein [Mycobacteroides abscessus subsp. abscessus]|nr:Uncharacterised protein [Mycobacteroides abscessus subsp. abscessus]